jgi:hypothetical protein
VKVEGESESEGWYKPLCLLREREREKEINKERKTGQVRGQGVRVRLMVRAGVSARVVSWS